jgi:hypothetical protein
MFVYFIKDILLTDEPQPECRVRVACLRLKAHLYFVCQQQAATSANCWMRQRAGSCCLLRAASSSSSQQLFFCWKIIIVCWKLIKKEIVDQNNAKPS